MSYEPLHHKYRPQSFAQLVGQEAIATTLSNAIRLQKIAPAYLFTGPRGTGKTSSARILAKSLNCISSQVPTATPCGKCVVCQGIASGSALDVIEIDAASNTGVDHIREIIERAQFAPVQCRYKVYVIDECHMLSVAAFNALLKTLEEPPEHVVFFLATTDPQRVLPTIISRCQRFDFRRIPACDIVAHLREIALIEQFSITDEALTLVAQVSQGGLRDAESLLDQLSLLSGQITVDRVWDLVGSVAEPDLLALLQAIALADPTGLISLVRQLMERGREALTILQNLAGCYRDLLIAKTAPDRHDLVSVTPSTWQALCELALAWNTPAILHGQQHLKNSEVQIKTSTQPRLWLEVTLLGLLHEEISSPATTRTEYNQYTPKSLPRTTTPPEDPNPPVVSDVIQPSLPPQAASTSLSPLVKNESISLGDTTEVVALTPAAETQPEVAETQLSDLNQVWQQLLQYLPLPSKALFKEHGRLVAINGQHAQIAIRSQKLLKIALPKVADVEAAFAKVLPFKIKVTLAAAENQSDNVPKEVPNSSITQARTLTKSAPATSVQVTAPISTAQLQPEILPTLDADVVSDAANNVQMAAEEVAIAAQRLADFFQGEVVTLKDATHQTTDSLAPQHTPLDDAEAFIDADDEF